MIYYGKNKNKKKKNKRKKQNKKKMQVCLSLEGSNIRDKLQLLPQLTHLLGTPNPIMEAPDRKLMLKLLITDANIF